MKHHVHDPERLLATAMVRHAIKDMRHKKLTGITDHVGAVCFLGSKGSTKWFDAINIDQESSLPSKMLTSTLKHFQRSHRGNNDA